MIGLLCLFLALLDYGLLDFAPRLKVLVGIVQAEVPVVRGDNPRGCQEKTRRARSMRPSRKARYGRTIMVRDTVKLKSTRSGVMQDGWSTQGYRYQQRRCAADDLVFGAEKRLTSNGRLEKQTARADHGAVLARLRSLSPQHRKEALLHIEHRIF